MTILFASLPRRELTCREVQAAMPPGGQAPWPFCPDDNRRDSMGFFASTVVLRTGHTFSYQEAVVIALASFLFLALTPHNPSGVYRITAQACNACHEGMTVEVAVEIFWTFERIRQHLIAVEKRKADDAAFSEWIEADRQMQEAIRRRDLREKAKQNPGG